MPLNAVLTSGFLRRVALRLGEVAACKKLLLAAFLLISSLFLTTELQAQLTVRFVPFAGNAQIDGRGIFPRLRAQLTVTKGTTPVPVTAQNVFIVENNLMVLPDRVTSLPGNVALVEWISTNKHDGTPTAIFVVDNGETGLITGAKNVADSTVVVIKDSTSAQLYGKIDLGRVPAGQVSSYGLKIAASRSLRGADGNELNTMLDSVRTRTANFSIEWIGAIIDKTPPPVDMVPAFDYRLNLIFKPLNDEPVADILTAYYANGFREDILLLANPAPYKRKQILQLISPNGGERLAPCEKVDISWKGMERGFAAFLEVSTDNGRTWSDIDSTLDSSYVWTVPPTLSDSVRIRVQQKLQSNFDRFAQGERAPTTTVAFSADGTRFVVGYTNRKLVEFSALDAQKIATYDVADVAPNANVTAITYVPGTSNLVAAVTTPSGSVGELQQFTSGSSAPTIRKPLPSGFSVAYLGTDSAGTTVYVVPLFKARVLSYIAASLDSTTPIILNAPASAARVLKNVITVMQLDGSVVSYNASTKQEQERTLTNFAADRYPVIRNMDIAGTGLAALGGQAPVSSPFRAQNQFTYVLDRATSIPRQVIHRAGVPTQVACAFSQTARYLGLGFMGQEQFELHDVETGKRLSSLTGSSGHNGFLSDLDFSPAGNAIVSTSIDSSANVLLKRFNTPEEDVSDGVFGIVQPQMSSATIQFAPMVIGSSRDTVLSGRVCNTGIVPVVIASGQFKTGLVFELPNGVPTDTLAVGACLDVHLRIVMTDTGTINDTLLISSCGSTFSIPFSIQGIDRHLEVVGDLTDFGEVCVGERVQKTFVMLRNADADSVRINNTQVVVPSQFRVVSAPIDTTLPPGGSLNIVVEFAPTRTGFDTTTFVVRYADQGTVRRMWRAMGRGIGAEIRLSHTALPFIPEVPVRDVTIYNGADNDVTITSGSITSGAPFTLLTGLPLTIRAHDSVALSIRYDGGSVGDSTDLALVYVPCAASDVVALSLYSGTAAISIPEVSADPRANTTIPVLAVIDEVVPYNGIRTLRGAFTVDPQLFLAQSITSSVGNAMIVSQEIVNNRRLIRFSIEGSFGSTNEIGLLSGPAGLGLADSSSLAPDTSAAWFGTSVVHTYTNGVLRIINPNPGRKILDNVSLAVISVQPNPATDNIRVGVKGVRSSYAMLRVMDQQSLVPISTLSLEPGSEPTSYTLNVSSLAPGVYTIVLTDLDATAAASFVVLR